MIHIGQWNELRVVKSVDFGLYLDGGAAGEILLPKRFVPLEAKDDDILNVFLYHDSEGRIIATTQKPLGTAGDIVYLKVVDTNRQGAFMDWGLMKDLFVPLSQQRSRMVVGGSYLVAIYLDDQTGRVAATEKIERLLSNDALTVKEGDAVELTIWRRTDLGYFVIINGKHTGVLHYSDVFRELETGATIPGFIKSILPENKLDVVLGAAGYARVPDAMQQVLSLLDDHNGYLPYNDSSDPDEVRDFFGMSKRTFKMTIGGLLKRGDIELTKTGIRRKAATL